jgi:hypothetical protein
MSADNGVYITRWKSKEGYFEYRVADTQNIENCDYGGVIPDRVVDAYRVLMFSDSVTWLELNQALDVASEIFGSLAVCEYGICLIEYDQPFPEMSVDEALSIVNSYWDEEIL